MVEKLKIILPLTAFLVIFVLLAILQSNSKKNGIKISNNDDKLLNADTNKPMMENAKFYSSKNNDFYHIEAEKIIQNNSEEIELFNINANIELKDQKKLNLLSNTGIFFDKEEKLILSGMVYLLISSGYEIYTESATVFLKKRNILGNNKVKIEGPIGILEADSFFVENNGDVITFVGNVSLEVDPTQK